MLQKKQGIITKLIEFALITFIRCLYIIMFFRFLLASVGFGIFFVSSQAFALRSIAEKEAECNCDLVLESSSLIYWTPDWFAPSNLANASEDANYWIQQVLPYEQYRYEDTYLVVPQLGMITPVVPIPANSTDFNTMVNGGEIAINAYLEHGSIEYPNSSKPGHWGKRVDFAHSNQFANAAGSFNNIFANLMMLDVGDQFWYFQRNSSGGYDLFKYNITASYNTSPSNTQALLRDQDGADALVFGCTHGLDGRWMVHGDYIGTPIGEPYNPYEGLNQNYKNRIDRAVRKISWLTDERRDYGIVQMISLLETVRSQYGLNGLANVGGDYRLLSGNELTLQYLEDELVLIYGT